MRRIFVFATVAATFACASYQPTRDTTQPDKVAKAMIACNSASDTWPDCETATPSKWFWKSTVIGHPYEAFWTFVGDTSYPGEKITWKITESTLWAYRAYETVKGGDGSRATHPGYLGEPVAAFAIVKHFDIWHQYNPATGEEMPVIYEAEERPWYDRQYMRVNWADNRISGFGELIGANIAKIFGEVKSELVQYNNLPNDPNHEVVRSDYVEVMTKEVVTPQVFTANTQLSPAHINLRNSFWRAPESDYAPLYYPDHAWNDDAVAKFGYFREARTFYDSNRGITDFKDYLMDRWDIWAKTHTTKSCTKDAECGGTAGDGAVCDKRAPALPEALSAPDLRGGICTMPYAQRGIQQIVYYFTPQFYEIPGVMDKYRGYSCRTVQQWNETYKDTVSHLLGISFTPKNFVDPTKPGYISDDKIACTFNGAPAPNEAFDPAKHDIFVLKDNVKDCNANLDHDSTEKNPRWCYRLGDVRYSFISYVDQAGSGTPLGVASWLADAETGQIRSAVANIFGGALDNYAGYVGDVYDLVSGNLTEQQVETGENVREYYEKFAGNSFPPSVPQRFVGSPDAESISKFQDALADKKLKWDELKRMGREARNAEGTKLAGSDVEKILVDNIEWRNMMGVSSDAPLDENLLDSISPFRAGFTKQRDQADQLENVLSKYCVMHANTFIDNAVQHLVDRAKAQTPPMSRDQAMNWIMGIIYRAVIEHEVGHTMGLRHNFEGSFDEENYIPSYWDKLSKNPEPDPTTFAVGGHPLPLSASEFSAYNTARDTARYAREKDGVKLYQYSSIMDYGGQFYTDLAGLGEYDKAAIRFGYGQLATVYDGPANASHSNRTTVPYYMGGDKCTADTDCPYNKVGQSCESILNGVSKVCTSWDADSAKDAVKHPPIQFRFCSDERVDDKPFCNRFDEGPSSTAIVQNLIDSYERNYVFNNFRRYREYYGGGYMNRIWTRYYRPMGKQFASLLFQVYYNQKSLLNNGHGSFSDMLEASVTAMDFFVRVLGTPDVGEYTPTILSTNPDGSHRQLYDITSRDCNAHLNDPNYFHACLGVGKFLYSTYEKGYYGAIERLARTGVFEDKILAMLALTNREWGQPFVNNETFPLNFYDGFGNEMLDLFTGLISGDLTRFAPTVSTATGSPQLAYRDIWQGKIFGATTADFGLATPVFSPAGSPPATRYATADLISPAQGSVYLQFVSLVLSLQGYQSFWDRTYPDYLQLYVFGQPQVHFNANGQDTVQYVSPLRSRTYIAVQTPDTRSIIFPLVKEASTITAQLNQYAGLTGSQLNGLYTAHKNDVCRFVSATSATLDLDCQTRLVDDLKNRLLNRESFLDTVNQVRVSFGLNN